MINVRLTIYCSHKINLLNQNADEFVESVVQCISAFPQTAGVKKCHSYWDYKDSKH